MIPKFPESLVPQTRRAKESEGSLPPSAHEEEVEQRIKKDSTSTASVATRAPPILVQQRPGQAKEQTRGQMRIGSSGTQVSCCASQTRSAHAGQHCGQPVPMDGTIEQIQADTGLTSSAEIK